MGGLVQIMPLASSFLFIFVMLNAGFPLSLSFYAEFLVLSALFVKCGALYIALLGASFVLLLYANIRLFTHICLGSVDPRRVSPASRDLSTIELYISALSFVYGANLFFNNEYYFWPLYLSSYGRYYI